MSAGRLISTLAIVLAVITFSRSFGTVSASSSPTDGADFSRLILSVQRSPARSAAQANNRNRGIQLYRERKFIEATKILRSVVKEDKTDHEAWYYLGLVLLPQPGKTKDAAKAFETAIKLQPNFASAHTGLAYTALQRNKSTEAVRESRAALHLDPTLAEPHYLIGVVHLRASDPEEALSEAGEAIRLNPDFAPAYLLRSQALVGISSKRSLEARRIIGSPPPPSPAERAERDQNRQANASQMKEAAASLRTYLKLDPNPSSAELWREQLETLEYYGVYRRMGTAGVDTPAFGDEVTTKARVLMKPEPSYTEAARQAQVVGTVVLRVVLSADGTVRHILVLAGLPNGLTENAVRAARMIKFTPATIDGKPVSTFIQLEYSFNLY